MRPVPRATKTFEGTIAQLFDQHVALVAPSPESVARAHALIGSYLRTGDPALVVRGTSAHRRTELRTNAGLRILPSDNAPAWWMHHLTWQEVSFSPGEFATALAGCPRHFHDVSARRENGISTAGWYVAHILPAKFGNSDPESWDAAGATKRFIRNVHPANHFYVPGKDRATGEDRRVIAYAARWSERRYGSIWQEMLTWAGSEAEDYLRTLPEVSGDEVVRIGGTSPSEKVISRAAVPGEDGVATYRKNRLWFQADVIEPLDWDQAFRIVTPEGTFEMTKKEFYEVFSNVVQTASYQIDRHYHCKKAPAKALRFKLEV